MHETDRRRALARGMARYERLVDDWPAFVDALARPLPACVWTRPGRLTPARLGALLEREGMEPETLAWAPGAFRLGRPEGLGNRWWYLAGTCHAQEEASLLPVTLLDPQPEERVLDLCAAPGGKTAAIAFAVGTGGTVVANDVSIERIRALRGTLDRLGPVNVTVTREDGCNYPAEAGPFDRVLVDAPCSAEGTLRKRSRVAGISSAAARGLAGRQRALLRKAVQLCRPGGRIVYATCTFAPEENEAVVDALLRECEADGLRTVEATVPGLRTAPGLTRWGGADFDPSLERAVRLWPHHNDTGGFFAVVLEKRLGTAAPPHAARPLEPAPAGEWLDVVGGRFGIPDEVWERYTVHRRRRSGLHLTGRGHRPPAAARIEGIGLYFLKTGMRYPKLSTPAALVLAGDVTRNVVDLEAEQARAYMRRLRVALGPGQDDRCTDTGYVLVRHGGLGLGLALYDAATRSLGSMYPKRWHGGPG